MKRHDNLSADEICTLFTEVALKADKCIDFDISYVSSSVLILFQQLNPVSFQWIKKYDDLRQRDIRFAEVAILILSAAQIYGRKVDYIEEFILNLCKNLQTTENGANNEK